MKQVERIYLTKGDNVVDSEGVKCDKCCAVQIEGTLYWLSQSFASPQELESELNSLGVVLTQDRGKSGLEWKWGMACDLSGWAICDKPFTKIAKHHDDVFYTGSSYMKKMVRNDAGSLWWTANQLSVSVLGSSQIQNKGECL